MSKQNGKKNDQQSDKASQEARLEELAKRFIAGDSEGMTVTRQPYVTFDHLCEIGDEGIKWDYNRQIDSDYIRQHVPSDGRFLVTMHFEHNHRDMKPCEPHMRLVIEMGDGWAFADVPMEYFWELPRAYVVRVEAEGEAVILCDMPDSEDIATWEAASTLTGKPSDVKDYRQNGKAKAATA